jgi:hypothetical protein
MNEVEVAQHIADALKVYGRWCGAEVEVGLQLPVRAVEAGLTDQF